MKEAQTTFQGSRLREARQARAISATSLSELIGISPSSISQYERDNQTPPPLLVAKMSEVLNLPAHFFTAPPEKTYNRCLRWRSQVAARKTARERAEKKYEWFRQVFQVIEQHVVFPPPNFPDLKMPSDPMQITHDDIEHAAEEVRQAWGLKNGPISNMVQLVENNGGVVIRRDMGDDGLDAYSDLDDAGTGRCFVVLGTDKDSSVRSRHNVGHELAHVILHKNIPTNTSRQTSVHKEMESQAARFASAFLMPASTFPQEVYSFSLDGLLHIKRRWGTAVSSMIMRLHDLGIIDDAKKRSLFIQISRRRWRKHEPLDDTLELEQPQLLRRSIEAAIGAGILDLDYIIMQTHLSQAEIEKSLGLETGHLDPGYFHGEQSFELRLSE